MTPRSNAHTDSNCDDEPPHRPLDMPSPKSRSRQRDTTQFSYTSSSSEATNRRPRSTPRGRNHHGIFASSATLLAGIGVAALVAHHFWPRGILYSAQEEWEKKTHHQTRNKSQRDDRRGHTRGRSSIATERGGSTYQARPRHRSLDDWRRQESGPSSVDMHRRDVLEFSYGSEFANPERIRRHPDWHERNRMYHDHMDECKRP